MLGKRIALFSLVALTILALSVPPALAGVGGCRTGRFGVGGCYEATPASDKQAKQDRPEKVKPSMLDSLSFIIPGHLVALAKGLLAKDKSDKQATIEGVGGCRSRFGVGGCYQ
jgi:hypothetical protein